MTWGEIHSPVWIDCVQAWLPLGSFYATEPLYCEKVMKEIMCYSKSNKSCVLYKIDIPRKIKV